MVSFHYILVKQKLSTSYARTLILPDISLNWALFSSSSGWSVHHLNPVQWVDVYAYGATFVATESHIGITQFANHIRNLLWHANDFYAVMAWMGCKMALRHFTRHVHGKELQSPKPQMRIKIVNDFLFAEI